MKTCAKCKVGKPHSDYHKDISRKDGLCGSCKVCLNERKKQANQAKSKARTDEVINSLDSEEDWRDIPGFEGLYKISNKGQVLSIGFHSKYGVLTPRMKSSGYQVELRKDRVASAHYIHRLLALVYIPNPEDLPLVEHLDKNNYNNDLSNLRWTSSQLIAKK